MASTVWASAMPATGPLIVGQTSVIIGIQRCEALASALLNLGIGHLSVAVEVECNEAALRPRGKSERGGGESEQAYATAGDPPEGFLLFHAFVSSFRAVQAPIPDRLSMSRPFVRSGLKWSQDVALQDVSPEPRPVLFADKDKSTLVSSTPAAKDRDQGAPRRSPATRTEE